MSDHSMYMYVVLLLCASSFLVGHNGFEEGMGASREEELELEKQLKLLNKPAVTTIHTKYGDIIDCVDFYKQPAFDHPLLKNHTFTHQMRPTSLPRRVKDQAASKIPKPATIGLKGGGCPIGTVPIRRITKEDLIRERFRLKVKSFEDNSPGTHYAVLRTMVNTNNKFIGAGAIFSTHNPHVDGIQYSAARVKIRNGPDSLEAGWRVDPTLYGDNLPRNFIRTDAGESHCFNTRCPGFIIVRSDIPLDEVVDEVSIIGRIFYTTRQNIIRDRAGNWWYVVGSDNIEVGFWPKSIFTGLGDLANYAEWGGESFSPLGNTPPEMGTGLLPAPKAFLSSAWFAKVIVINKYGQTVDVDNTEEFADNPSLYKVRDEGDTGDQWGRVVKYGGPWGRLV